MVNVLLTVIVGLAWVHAARSDEICCSMIGCYSDDPPFDGITLPQCVEQMTPGYMMFTRANRDTAAYFDHNANTIPSVFNRNLQTVFLVHGWNSNGNSGWMHTQKNAFLDRGEYNVVIVDWGGGATNPNYFQAASNTRTAGAYTALVFANLVNNGGLSDSLTWCIGHSLGSHHCGHAGMKTQLERVTGLDPAGPFFQGKDDKTVGINQSSGRFVDIIHTDNDLGQLRDLGHIDFYPGGGADQPGCPGSNCDHGRAPTYMTESIRRDCFASRSRCTDPNNVPGSCIACTCGAAPCAEMGFGANTACQRSGLFFVDVTGTSPYCPIG